MLAKLARERLDPPAQRVSVIFINDIYGSSLSDVFTQKFEELGGEVLQTASFNTGESSYFDVLETAMRSEPDSVLLVAFPGDGAQIIRDWRTSGLAKNVRWLATDGLREDRFVQGAGVDTIQYLVGTAPLLKGTHFEPFSERYRAFWGNETPGIFTSNQYDAMILIGLGIASAGNSADVELANAIRDVSTATTGATGVDLTNLSDALNRASLGESIDYEGASGSVDINATGDILTNYRVWRVGGRGRIVESECNWRCTRAGTDDCEVVDEIKCEGL